MKEIFHSPINYIENRFLLKFLRRVHDGVGSNSVAKKNDEEESHKREHRREHADDHDCLRSIDLNEKLICL